MNKEQHWAAASLPRGKEISISLHRVGFETKSLEDCERSILWNNARCVESPAGAACPIGERMWTRPRQRMPRFASRTSPRRRWSI